MLGYRSLKPGDPWTFIYPVPILNESGEPVEPGHLISKWFATNEAGRLFRVVRVTGSTYETEYVGFCPQPEEAKL